MGLVSRCAFPVVSILFILFCSASLSAREESWIEVRSPHFVLLSNAPEKPARRIVHEFEQFREVIHVILPRLRIDSGSPLLIFALKTENDMKALLPESYGQKGMVRPAGFFQAGAEKNYVILRLDVQGQQRYHVIYHEYVHSLVRLNFHYLPLWLNEGLAEFFSQASLSDKLSHLGQPSEQQLMVLRDFRESVPLDALLTADHSSPYYREEKKAALFYAQSWALTHYLMVSDKGARAPLLGKYMELIQSDVPEREAAVRAFGNLDALQDQLAGYISGMAFYSFRVPTQLISEEDNYAVRALPKAELNASLGDYFVSQNRLQAARAALNEALLLDPKSAAAHEAMGLCLMREGEHAKAIQHFSESAALNSRSFLVHYYTGMALQQEGTDAAQEFEAEKHLRRAVELNASFAPAFSALAAVLAERGKYEDAIEFTRKAAQLEPGELTHRLSIGRLLLRMKRYEDAMKYAEQLVARASGEDKPACDMLLQTVRGYRDAQNEIQRRLGEQTRKLQELQQRRDAQGAAQDSAAESSLAHEVSATSQKAGETGIPNRPTERITGVVANVTCEFPATIELTIESLGAHFTLQAENYYKVQYHAVGKPGRNDFEPCTELKGAKVEVTYWPVAGKSYAGTIQAVAIIK